MLVPSWSHKISDFPWEPKWVCHVPQIVMHRVAPTVDDLFDYNGSAHKWWKLRLICEIAPRMLNRMSSKTRVNLVETGLDSVLDRLIQPLKGSLLNLS